jgi:hypothetical protein
MEHLEDETLLRAKALMISLFNARNDSTPCEEVSGTKSEDSTSSHLESKCDFNNKEFIDEFEQKISDAVSLAVNEALSVAFNTTFARLRESLGYDPDDIEGCDQNNNGTFKSFTEMGFTFTKQPRSNKKDEAYVTCDKASANQVQKYTQTLITDYKQYLISDIINNNNMIVGNDKSYETKSKHVIKKYKCRNITEFFESDITTNNNNGTPAIGLESEKVKQPDSPGTGASELQDWKWVTPPNQNDQDNQLVKLSEEQATPITTNDLYLSIQKPRDILKIMTDWNPEWMFRNYTSNDNDSQILTKSQFPLKMLPSQFDSLEDNRVSFVPLILHELWSSINKDYEEKKSKDEEDLVPGLIRKITPYDERFTTFYFNAVLCPSEKDGDMYKCNTFVSIGFYDKVKSVPVIIYGFVDEIKMAPGIMHAWCQNLVHTRRGNANASIPVRYLLRTRKLTETEIENFSLDKATIVSVKFLSSIGPDLTKAEALINLSRTSLKRSLIKPTAETLSFPKLPGILHPDIRDLYAFSKLNKIQKEVVVGVSEACLKNPTTDKVCLVQGPPGTGKSSTICGILLQILATHGLQDKSGNRPRILVCAPSNSAVDSVCLKLIDIKRSYSQLESLQFVRLGVPESTHPDVQQFCFQTASGSEHAGDMKCQYNQLKTMQDKVEETKKAHAAAKEKGDDEEMNKLAAQYEEKVQDVHSIKAVYNGQEKSAKKKLLKDADIILTTLSSSYHTSMQQFFQETERKISVCIIDEAGQCVEPEALIPLQYNINKLVMVGDHKQLPATVISRTAKDHRYDASLFKRLFTCAEEFNTEGQNSGVMLTTQYRMHPAIASWPNQHFYSGLIQQGVHRPEISVVPYTFIDSNSTQTVLKNAICNDGEVGLVKEVIATIKDIITTSSNSADKQLSIGVITFYRWQKEKLLLMADEDKLTDVEINTVDGFQGAEKDIIIISCVRSGSSIGFLSEGERLNVALTRAKRSLIILGNINTFERKSSMWKQLIQDARAKNVVFAAGAQSMKSILSRGISGC